MQTEYIVKTMNGERYLCASEFSGTNEPSMSIVGVVGDDDDARDVLTSMGINPPNFKTFADADFSGKKQKAEAVRSIVTAQHEFEAMMAGRLSGKFQHIDTEAEYRRNDACEWLALCAA